VNFPPRFTGRQTSTWTIEIATRLIAGAGDLRRRDQRAKSEDKEEDDEKRIPQARGRI